MEEICKLSNVHNLYVYSSVIEQTTTTNIIEVQAMGYITCIEKKEKRIRQMRTEGKLFLFYSKVLNNLQYNGEIK